MYWISLLVSKWPLISRKASSTSVTFISTFCQRKHETIDFSGMGQRSLVCRVDMSVALIIYAKKRLQEIVPNQIKLHLKRTASVINSYSRIFEVSSDRSEVVYSRQYLKRVKVSVNLTNWVLQNFKRCET